MHRVGSRVGYIGVINVHREIFGQYISLEVDMFERTK